MQYVGIDLKRGKEEKSCKREMEIKKKKFLPTQFSLPNEKRK